MEFFLLPLHTDMRNRLFSVNKIAPYSGNIVFALYQCPKSETGNCSLATVVIIMRFQTFLTMHPCGHHHGNRMGIFNGFLFVLQTWWMTHSSSGSWWTSTLRLSPSVVADLGVTCVHSVTCRNLLIELKSSQISVHYDTHTCVVLSSLSTKKDIKPTKLYR